jgi:hypothetical protein
MNTFLIEYRKDPDLFNRLYPAPVLERLLGRHKEEVKRGDAWEPPDAVELKQKYNELLKQAKELEIFIDNKNYPSAALTQKVDEYKDVTASMSDVTYELKMMGIEMTEGEIENGFSFDKP